MATAGLALTGLAVTSSLPAVAALPSQCVTSGSVVTCTLSQNTSSNSMALSIPADVTSIQVHAVGEKGGGARSPGAAAHDGGKPAAIDASIPVAQGEVITAHLLDDGGAAGASADGNPEAGAGGSSVVVTRGSEVLIQAAGGGGAGAFVPVLQGGQYTYSAGGNADSYGFRAADNAPGDRAARGGMPGREEYPEGGYGGPGASLWNCPNYLTFPHGANGTSSSGGSGGDGGYGGGGGGGGSLGGGGGGAGGTGCEGYSYGGGGGGGGSVMPWNAAYSYSTTESYLVRISFWVGPRSSHSPSAMSFGQVAVGSTSAVQTMTVTNTGSLPLTLGAGAFGGSNPGSFQKASDTCSNATVAPGATCQVGLQFAPLATGALSATFAVPDDSQASPHVVTLSGTSAALSSHSPSAMSFGQVAVGSTSAVQTMTVTNTGSLPLTLGAGALGGTNPASFRKVSDTCSNATVAPGATCQVGLQFAPLIAGALSATFTLADNSQANPHVVPLSGTGAAESSHSPSSMSFGQVAVGYTSAVHTMTVTNTGSVPLQVGGGFFGGNNADSFRKSGDSCSGRTVAPGATCQVGFVFRPPAEGDQQATFTLMDNSVASPHVVVLSGTGTRPVAVTSVSSLDFGAQEVGKPGAVLQTVELKNTGTGSLVVNGTTIGGPHASDFGVVSDTCAGAAVASNSSCSVTLRMTASGAGGRVAFLVFSHNAPPRSSEVRLTGIGTPPADLKIRGIGSIYTGRDHLVTRTVAGPGTLMTYPLTILNEDTVARSYRIALAKSGDAATAEVWTTGFGAKELVKNGGTYVTTTIQPNKSVTYNLRVTPTAPGQTISRVDVALLSDGLGLIESVRTETNTGAPFNGTSSSELFSRQGSQLFVGGPVNGQTSTSPALNVGGSAQFTLRLKNNGSSSQRIGLRLSDMDGCAASFAVTVTDAGKVVTTAAFNGTYLTPLLAPTKYRDVFVTIKRVAAGCPSKTIRAQSLNNGVAVRTSYLLANAAYNAATD